MSGQKPLFITGATCKLRINNKTMAFATDFSCQVDIKHVAPKVLGLYESYTIEPLSYDVVGGFTIIRYAQNIQRAFNSSVTDMSTNDDGNGIGSWGAVPPGEIGLGTFAGNDGRANENLDPSKFHIGTFFDIELYQMTPVNGLGSTGLENFLERAGGFLQGRSNQPKDTDKLIQIVKLRDCRITGSKFSINKKNVAQENFSFRALYYDNDSMKASASGVGQTSSQ